MPKRWFESTKRKDDRAELSIVAMPVRRQTSYHYLPATRADLLRRLGRAQLAAESYRQAIGLAENDVERLFLEGRLAALPLT